MEEELNPEQLQSTLKGSYSIIPGAPVKVGNRRQLLMDDYIIDDWWDCRRTVHKPEKYAGNPLIVPEKPWEGPGPGGGMVLYDEEMGRYRMWSNVCDEELVKTQLAFTLRTIYYESADGIHWERPELGLIEYEGSKANNLIFGDQDWLYGSVCVISLPPRLHSRGRYAMIYDRYSSDAWAFEKAHTMPQQRIALSEDGIHWQDQAENPAFRGLSDTDNNLLYDPDRDVFLHFRRRTINAYQIRRLACSQSKDLISWTQPMGISTPDELDPPMHYGMPVCLYQGVYLGFLQMFYVDRLRRLPKSHQIDAQLVWSRDGIHWGRHPERPIFLECGLMDGLDWGMVFVWKEVIERDGHLRIYYGAHPRLHTEEATGTRGPYFCLATLRKDGFVSIDSVDDRDGHLLTRPMECPGGKLHINARTRADGFVKVAVRGGEGESDGERLPEWGQGANVPFSGDSIDHVVNWKGQENLEAFAGKAVRLQFRLKQAELYSFWFE